MAVQPNLAEDTSIEDDHICRLVKNGSWEILLAEHRQNRFLPWIWPSAEDLTFIAKAVQRLGAKQIVSVGCGSGLLEWLIYNVTGLPVMGVEVDRSWWTSKYSHQTFIPMEYAEDFDMGYNVADKNDALLFCYFNNQPAFLQYLQLYKGNCLLVIGPGEGRGTHTAPTPFQLAQKDCSISNSWALEEIHEISSGKDFVGVFTKTK